jgi:hypothetical protein
MSNLLYLKHYKPKFDILSYKAKIEKMDKFELLAEMVSYQAERSELEYLTPSLLARGKILFAELEKASETEELRKLCGYYLKSLISQEFILKNRL